MLGSFTISKNVPELMNNEVIALKPQRSNIEWASEILLMLKSLQIIESQLICIEGELVYTCPVSYWKFSVLKKGLWIYKFDLCNFEG